MASLSFSIPDGMVTRVEDAFAAVYGYQPQILDPNNPGATVPNPQTKQQFVRERLRQYTKETVAQHEAGKASADAAAQARDDIG